MAEGEGTAGQPVATPDARQAESASRHAEGLRNSALAAIAWIPDPALRAQLTQRLNASYANALQSIGMPGGDAAMAQLGNAVAQVQTAVTGETGTALDFQQQTQVLALTASEERGYQEIQHIAGFSQLSREEYRDASRLVDDMARITGIAVPENEKSLAAAFHAVTSKADPSGYGKLDAAVNAIPEGTRKSFGEHCHGVSKDITGSLEAIKKNHHLSAADRATLATQVSEILTLDPDTQTRIAPELKQLANNPSAGAKHAIDTIQSIIATSESEHGADMRHQLQLAQEHPDLFPRGTKESLLDKASRSKEFNDLGIDLQHPKPEDDAKLGKLMKPGAQAKMQGEMQAMLKKHGVKSAAELMSPERIDQLSDHEAGVIQAFALVTGAQYHTCEIAFLNYARGHEQQVEHIKSGSDEEKRTGLTALLKEALPQYRENSPGGITLEKIIGMANPDQVNKILDALETGKHLDETIQAIYAGNKTAVTQAVSDGYDWGKSTRYLEGYQHWADQAGKEWASFGDYASPAPVLTASPIQPTPETLLSTADLAAMRKSVALPDGGLPQLASPAAPLLGPNSALSGADAVPVAGMLASVSGGVPANPAGPFTGAAMTASIAQPATQAPEKPAAKGVTRI